MRKSGPEIPSLSIDMNIRSQLTQLLAEIEQEARQTADFTGRPAFSPRVMEALAEVPRHKFVREDEETLAYVNGPLPIGYNQTISQPYIVALMTDLLDLNDDSTVLEIGTGSGYQTAILAEIARQVYSIEIIAALATNAGKVLQELGYTNIHLKSGDGYYGWPEYAPFDRIIVTAASENVPEPLIQQLNPEGRLVIPIGDRIHGQDLTLVTNDQSGHLTSRNILPVVFVPFTRSAH
jgi:protein-L-isoaspartate(D-aspartate) O-methyltransferase